MTKILVADDHQMFRQGLCSMLDGMDKIKVVGQVTNGLEALEFLKVSDVDLVLMDINMPQMSGIEAMSECKSNHPDVKVIMLSMHNGRDTIQRALGAGAHGYLLKNSSKKDLGEAILKVSQGENYFVEEVKEVLVNSFRSPNIPTEIRLTPREKDILKLICAELTTQEIADRLHISTNTVETHRKNMLSKTGCKNGIGLARFAMENGL